MTSLTRICCGLKLQASAVNLELSKNNENGRNSIEEKQELSTALNFPKATEMAGPATSHSFDAQLRTIKALLPPS